VYYIGSTYYFTVIVVLTVVVDVENGELTVSRRLECKDIGQGYNGDSGICTYTLFFLGLSFSGHLADVPQHVLIYLRYRDLLLPNIYLEYAENETPKLNPFPISYV